MAVITINAGEHVASTFGSGSLTRQFALAGGLVMLATAALAGTLASSIVTRTAIENTAAATALFMGSFLSSYVQRLEGHETLPPEAKQKLDRLLGTEAFEQRFPSVDIWNGDGVIAYSRSNELIGRQFAPPEGLVTALNGEVAAQYADLDAQEHVGRQINKGDLEIYIPLREDHSGRVIAVAEIHELPGPLEEELFVVRLQAWLATAGLTLLVMASLSGIVYRASRTIQQQQKTLRRNLEELRKASEQNRLLRERSQRASSNLTELTAGYLRNVGAELHDGPAQMVGLAALRIEHIRRASTAAQRDEQLDAMGDVLDEALRDIRTISKGLILPEIEVLPVGDIVKLAVAVHEQRTGSSVKVDCRCGNVAMPHAVKICLYRFIQEALNNAFKHAGGAGQRVFCELRETELAVVVEDSGPGMPQQRDPGGDGLGLAGMRDRVESLGGMLSVSNRPGGGTRLEMTVNWGLDHG